MDDLVTMLLFIPFLLPGFIVAVILFGRKIRSACNLEAF